jgi:hypothetical protein
MQNLIQDYLKGEMLSDLSKKYNINYSTAKRILVKQKIKLRTRAESLTLQRNCSCFKSIDSEEKAYWLGFIAADGSIDLNKNKLQITLKSDDLEHLIKFQKFVNTKISPKIYSIKHNNISYNICSIHVISKELVQDLTLHNIVPNKSLIYSPNLNLIPKELEKHFWRGYIDGDGYIGVIHENRPSFSIVGTQETLTQFLEFTGLNKKLYQRNTTTNTFQVNFVYRKALFILELLYKTSSVYLDRKYYKAKKLSIEYRKIINIKTNLK